VGGTATFEIVAVSSCCKHARCRADICCGVSSGAISGTNLGRRPRRLQESRPAGCLRFLGGTKSCTEKYTQLYSSDDGTGLQRVSGLNGRLCLRRRCPSLLPAPSCHAFTASVHPSCLSVRT
jgi:hypothetical protein